MPLLAEKEKGDKDHEPDKDTTEEGDAEHVNECSRRITVGEHSGNAEANGGDEQRIDGRAVSGNAPQHGWRVSAAGEREHHAGGEIDIAVHARERGSEHHEIDNVGGSGDSGPCEYAHEGTGS